MKNYIQPGDTVTIPAPADITSGSGVLVGSLFGIASTNATTGEDVAVAVKGVFDLPKEATTDAFDIGDNVKWDVDNDRVTSATTTNRNAVVIAAATATASTVRVRLSN